MKKQGVPRIEDAGFAEDAENAVLSISFITKTALKCSGYVTAVKIT